jgi:hypothetical protein
VNILSCIKSTNHIYAKKHILIKLNLIDCISWFHLNASYVLGNKIAKNRDCQYNDLGKPQFFYEVVQYWVAFELVQVLQKFGLNPEFKTNLNRWSNDMNWVVQYMKKTQLDTEKKRAQECIDILFNQKKQSTMGRSYAVNTEQKRISNI